MLKIKPERLDYINDTLGKSYDLDDVGQVEVNSEDGDLDIYSPEGDYVDTIPKENMSISLTDLTEQNEDGIGRPKILQYKIKRNRLKFTISNVAEGVWYFLPMITIAEMKEFLRNIDCKCSLTDVISQLLRGGVAYVTIPENREPYLKEVLRKGEEGNPYKMGKDATNVNLIKGKLGLI
jgi:hypothetical protein